VRTGVSNFFGNIDDVFIAVNNLLQGKVTEAAGDVSRVFLNSTIGVLGIFDVASEAGIEKHDEDFGQTFGRWGAGDGAYLVLPIIGPSTVRDGFGEILDIKADPITRMNDVAVRNTMGATRGIDQRSRLLPTDKIVEEAALDRYAYIRDAYLQRRRSKIYDGDPPRESDNAADSADASSARVFAGIRLEPVVGSTNLFVERELETAAQPASQVAQAMPEARMLMLSQVMPAASRR
jgi:phospholipid-binding lipoprotein MlaA